MTTWAIGATFKQNDIRHPAIVCSIRGVGRGSRKGRTMIAWAGEHKLEFEALEKWGREAGAAQGDLAPRLLDLRLNGHRP